MEGGRLACAAHGQPNEEVCAGSTNPRARLQGGRNETAGRNVVANGMGYVDPTHGAHTAMVKAAPPDKRRRSYASSDIAPLGGFSGRHVAHQEA